MADVRLPAHITEEDIALIARIILPDIAAKAWDEGAKWGAAEVSGYDDYESTQWLAPGDNPYRSKGEA